MNTLTLRVTLTGFAALIAFALAFTPVLAHNGEDHSDDSTRVEKMEALVALLQQLVALLTQQAEHALDDEHGHESSTDMDLSGIHIMADGTVMLGSGEEVHDATVNDEGMIVLSDGRVIEPVSDLRSDLETAEWPSMWAEVHNDTTHIHYLNEDGELSTFFVESEVTDQAGVIADVAAETGLDEDTVESLLSFDDVTEHSDEDDDHEDDHDDHDEA